MALAADDHVVMNEDAELLGGLDDQPGHVDVGPRRLADRRRWWLWTIYNIPCIPVCSSNVQRPLN